MSKHFFHHFLEEFTGEKWYVVGETDCNFCKPTESNKIEKYVISKEWKEQNINEQIGVLNKRIEYYESQSQKLSVMKNDFIDKISELEKERDSL